MKSLRKQVFDFYFEALPSISQCYKAFGDYNKATIEQYYYQAKKEYEPHISTNIELTNIDTIKEMEHSINQIKDPVKRCENLSRLHAMKLKPIKNQNEISLKEMLDG